MRINDLKSYAAQDEFQDITLNDSDQKQEYTQYNSTYLKTKNKQK